MLGSSMARMGLYRVQKSFPRIQFNCFESSVDSLVMVMKKRQSTESVYRNFFHPSANHWWSFAQLHRENSPCNARLRRSSSYNLSMAKYNTISHLQMTRHRSILGTALQRTMLSPQKQEIPLASKSLRKPPHSTTQPYPFCTQTSLSTRRGLTCHCVNANNLVMVLKWPKLSLWLLRSFSFSWSPQQQNETLTAMPPSSETGRCLWGRLSPSSQANFHG